MRENIVDSSSAVLPLYVIIYHAALERSRTIERDGIDELSQPRGFDLFYEFSETGTLTLKDTLRISFLEGPVNFFIIELDLLKTYLHIVVLPDEVEGVLDDRQRSKAEKIELNQADFLDVLHRELGCNVAV